MRVVSLCEHLTRGDRNPDHWIPYNIVRGIKGDPIRGYAWVRIGGHERRLDQARADNALDWAAERLSAVIRRDVAGSVAVVPVPGHACVSAADVRASRLFQLATRTAAAITSAGGNAIAAPLAHWDTAQQSARAGGSRDPLELLPHCRIATGVQATITGRTAVLLDDVVTTGAHLRAFEHHLRRRGVGVSPICFAVARTVHEKGVAVSEHVEVYDELEA